MLGFLTNIDKIIFLFSTAMNRTVQVSFSLLTETICLSVLEVGVDRCNYAVSWQGRFLLCSSLDFRRFVQTVQVVALVHYRYIKSINQQHSILLWAIIGLMNPFIINTAVYDDESSEQYIHSSTAKGLWKSITGKWKSSIDTSDRWWGNALITGTDFSVFRETFCEWIFENATYKIPFLGFLC